MKRHSRIKTILIFAILIMIAFTGCSKKNGVVVPDQQNGNTNPVIPLPDSTMFVGASTRDSSVVYLLNASTGALVNKYGYPRNTGYKWCIPFAGNGFLYAAENNTLTAMNISTGAILWTDSLKSYASYPPVLHNDTFYGIYTTGLTSGHTVYALDATKKSGTFLWQYSLSNTPSIFLGDGYISYYNGIVYVAGGNPLSGNISITALDAKTGTLKFTLNNCSLSSLNNGIIISGNTLIDATTGSQTGTVPPSLLVTNTSQYASLVYATKNLFFTRIINSTMGNYSTYSSTSKLNAYDTATGSIKWSIDGGNNAFNSDTSRTVVQVFNNQAIIKTTMAVSAGIYGSVSSVNYSGADINTGQIKWTYAAGLKGQSFTINNIRYDNGTLTLNPALGQPASTSIVAADMFSGKIKWRNNNLYVVNNGTNALCLFTAGTGYSAYIQ